MRRRLNEEQFLKRVNIVTVACMLLIGLAMVGSAAMMRAAVFDKPSLDAQQILQASKRLAGW